MWQFLCFFSLIYIYAFWHFHAMQHLSGRRLFFFSSVDLLDFSWGLLVTWHRHVVFMVIYLLFFSRRTDFLSWSTVRTKCQCNDLSMLFWYPAMILWIFLKNHRICCGNNSIRTKRAATTFEIEQINYTWAYNFSCKNNNNSDVFECAVRNRREKRR